MIIGIGTDIVEIKRIKKAIDRWGEGFLKHILTDEEIAGAKRYQQPFAHYAGRFAAKEAIFKAMRDPQFSWHDVTITNDSQGRPMCQYHRRNFKKHILISISHSKDYATAFCIVTS